MHLQTVFILFNLLPYSRNIVAFHFLSLFAQSLHHFLINLYVSERRGIFSASSCSAEVQVDLVRGAKKHHTVILGGIYNLVSPGCSWPTVGKTSVWTDYSAKIDVFGQSVICFQEILS